MGAKYKADKIGERTDPNVNIEKRRRKIVPIILGFSTYKMISKE